MVHMPAHKPSRKPGHVRYGTQTSLHVTYYKYYILSGVLAPLITNEFSTLACEADVSRNLDLVFLNHEAEIRDIIARKSL